VILLTRLNGQGFVLNPDLILKAESTPDTVVTLVDGTKFVVLEPLDVLSSRVVQYRAQVVATARELPGREGQDAADRPSGHHDLFAVEGPALVDADGAAHRAADRAADLAPDLAPDHTTAPVLAEPVPLRRRRRL
jgi:flagellar protein FlbD